MPDNRQQMNPAATYILGNLANSASAVVNGKPQSQQQAIPYNMIRNLPPSLQEYMLRPPTPAELSGRSVPTMSAYTPYKQPFSDSRFQSYEDWMKTVPPEYRNAWKQLPAGEIARLSGDIVHDSANTVLRGTMKIPNVLLGVPALVGDAFNQGMSYVPQGFARIGQFLRWDGYDDRKVEEIDDLMHQARADYRNGTNFRRGLDWWDNKVNELTPYRINDPQPNVPYTKFMHAIGGEQPSYSTMDAVRQAGEIATSTSGAIRATDAMGMLHPEAPRIVSPVQHKDIVTAGKALHNRIPKNMVKTRAATRAVGQHVGHMANSQVVNTTGGGLANASRVLHLKKHSPGSDIADWWNFLTPAGATNLLLQDAATEVVDEELDSGYESYKPHDTGWWTHAQKGQ